MPFDLMSAFEAVVILVFVVYGVFMFSLARSDESESGGDVPFAERDRTE